MKKGGGGGVKMSLTLTSSPRQRGASKRNRLPPHLHFFQLCVNLLGNAKAKTGLTQFHAS